MTLLRRLLVPALLVAACAAGAERPLAPWPPPAGPLRVIIDADAANEVDDQFAIALALGFPERIRLEGLVAAHFGVSGGSAGIEKSYAEIQKLLELTGQTGKIPVKRGADPIVYYDRLPQSEGVDFIIEKARSATPDRPIWLVLLGPATDAAVALLKEPSIADRLVVFWHGRTQWPVRCWNFNAINDIKAVQTVFEQPCRLVLFDTGTYLTLPMEESARRFAPLGPVGKYLHEIRGRNPYYSSPQKGFYDMGDVAAVVDERSVRWHTAAAPAVDHDLRYDFSRKLGDIVRIYHVERDYSFDLLEKALQRLKE